MSNSPDCVLRLVESGISINDAHALRRIAMTLHRWHELECGNSNDATSWSIVRGRWQNGAFDYDDAGDAYMERHYHRADAKAHYHRIPDRERGALKRLAEIMKAYPGRTSYVQTDPRGASLYILPAGETEYTRGIAIYK